MTIPPHRRWRVYLVVVLGGLVLGGGAWAWLVFGSRSAQKDDGPRPDPPPPDPRVTFPTPFRNVRPEVAYVGDAVCATCHEKISRTFRNHPMGRSAELVARSQTPDVHFAGANNPLSVPGYELRVEKSGDRIWHRMTALGEGREAIPPYRVSADLSIGSGHHGRSYLTIDQGAVWQSPISWFRQGEHWDVSPGFDLAAMSRRPILSNCLYCHVDRVEPVPGSLNRYSEPLLPFQASIGCERCHGPGQLHVAERTGGGAVARPDYSIVNPAHLPTDLKGDVCRQCHLQAQQRLVRRGRDVFEFRPGLPWDQFVTIFVPHPSLTDFRRSVGQFEQMERSRCYTASAGRFSCTSCHNPHVSPEPDDVPRYYRERCLKCHETHGCSLPAAERRAKNDSCVACHMPPRDSSNISHAAVTDHRVMRRPDSGEPQTNTLPAGQLPVIPYPPGPHAPPPEERERDWGIVLGREVGQSTPTRPVAPELWRAAQSKLEAALERWPGDAECWLTLSSASSARADHARALSAVQNALALKPDSEIALLRLTHVAVTTKDHALHARTAEKLVAINPSSAENRASYATALAEVNDWERAEAESRAALAIYPLHAKARLILGVCLHRRGDPGAGRTQLDLALMLVPSSQVRAEMSDWYRQHTR